MRLLLSHELRRARAAFARLGRIPYDIAVTLERMGQIPAALEQQWALDKNLTDAMEQA